MKRRLRVSKLPLNQTTENSQMGDVVVLKQKDGSAEFDCVECGEHVFSVVGQVERHDRTGPRYYLHPGEASSPFVKKPDSLSAFGCLLRNNNGNNTFIVTTI